MNLDAYNHYIVFYITVERENTLMHLVGFNHKPTIDDTHDVLIEFKDEILPKLNAKHPVYMIYMNPAGVKELFGFTGEVE